MKMRLLAFVMMLLCLFGIGVLFFALYHQWITVSWATREFVLAGLRVQPMERKEIVIWYWHHDRLVSEKKWILWGAACEKNMTHVVEAWVNLMEEEALIPQQVNLQSVLCAPDARELFVSFDTAPFASDASVRTKLLVVEGLLKTIRETDASIIQIHLLVQHQPLDDYHLDFSRGWPTVGFLGALSFPSQQEYACSREAPFTLMLDPAGDARSTGRVLGDTFERGVTLQCAERIKKYVEEHMPAVRVIVTRVPGETVEPLQNASFANRLAVDWYVRLHFYEEKGPEKPLALYIPLYSAQDTVPVQDIALTWVPYTSAYRSRVARSYTWASALAVHLKRQSFGPGVIVQDPHGVPFKPLLVVRAPSCAFEMGVPAQAEWHRIADSLAVALVETIQSVCL